MPKPAATYIDAAGNKVTVKVSGISASTFIGNILFPTGGPTTGVNPIGIVINGTTAKSTLTISTKTTSLDFIDVEGSLKSLSAKGVNLSRQSFPAHQQRLISKPPALPRPFPWEACPRRA